MAQRHSSEQRRSIAAINRKLAGGAAVIMTAEDLCQDIRSGRQVRFDDVDIITAATCGLMSGTYAVLSFQFCEPNRFVRAARLYLNGIEGYPGPCPNERIGLIDAIVYGTRHSRDDPRYGGGHLFRDIVAGNAIDVEVVTDSGQRLRKAVSIAAMPHAMLHGSRQAFRNYVGFVNPSRTDMATIFCSRPLPGHLKGATACGCGEINPLEKDPGLRTIGVGTRVMINGGIGYVTGLGTRSSAKRPCLTVVADMHTMNPDYMGGFQTSSGPEVIQTWAVPIPVVDEIVFETVRTLDEQIPLTVTDVGGRMPVAEATYADLWTDTTRRFIFDAAACAAYRDRCADCPPALLCPSGAFTEAKDKIDGRRCFHCGICATSCHGNCFAGAMGKVVVDGKTVPFVQRLSDRVTATAAAAELKARLRNGTFTLSVPVAPIHPR